MVSPTAHAVDAPSLGIPRRRALVLVGAGAALVASVVLVLPSFADLPDTWERLTHGDARWLVLALGLEAVSFLGHIILFRAVGDDGRGRVGMRASTEITLAGHAATRLLASGGAGGVALTAWALRRSGMERADVAARMTTFLVLLYAVYMAALVLGGVGLFTGVLPGTAPLALTLVPAAFGAAVIAVALALPRLSDVLQRARQRGCAIGRIAPAASGVGDGVRDAVRMARRLDPGLVGALLWWAGDVAVLWACFEAFGDSPAVAVIVMAYFVGMLANTLPLPGGIGGVDGGMVAALVAFGSDPALAVVAVLAYRGFAFWLPIVPGAAAWITLRRTVAGWQHTSEGPSYASPRQRWVAANTAHALPRAA
jgi:putative heme transporter